MKICFVELQPFPYNVGGGTFHLIGLSKYLIKMGHDVSIVTSKPGNNQEKLDVDPKLKIYSVGIPHKIFKKTGILSSIYALAYRILWELTWVFKARKKIKEINPDICNPQSLITTALPCSFLKIPFVASQHGIYLDGFRKLWSERKSKTVLLLSKIYEKLENFNGKRAKFIICVNNSTFDYYKKFGKDKCKVITVGIDGEDFKDISFKEKKEYLFMGRITEQKGLKYLIDALEILDREGVKIKVNIVGDGEKEYVDSFKDRTKKLKNIEVKFLGIVVGREKNKIYDKTKVFISPSIFEPLGIVIVEAMASGCAIISADHDGGKLLVKPSYGKLVKFGSERDRARNLAKAIRESLKWNIKRMGPLARTNSKYYNYSNLSKENLEVFKRVIGNKSK